MWLWMRADPEGGALSESDSNDYPEWTGGRGCSEFSDLIFSSFISVDRDKEA